MAAAAAFTYIEIAGNDELCGEELRQMRHVNGMLEQRQQPTHSYA
jgi:hypothetical protein